jgi:hypothetical protein
VNRGGPYSLLNEENYINRLVNLVTTGIAKIIADAVAKR